MRALDAAEGVTKVVDLGCGGTGRPRRIGAEAARASTESIGTPGGDRSQRTYKALKLGGRAAVGTIQRASLAGARGTAILAAYAVNEPPDADRDALLLRLVEAHNRGARVLIVEPIARRINRCGTVGATRSRGGEDQGVFLELPWGCGTTCQKSNMLTC